MFIGQARRVVRPGGVIVSVDVAPGWYGGELAGIVDDPGADMSCRLITGVLWMMLGLITLILFRLLIMVA